MTREQGLTERIGAYLKEHKSLTSMQAVQLFGTARLSARIFDLKERGYKIATLMTYGTDPVTKENYKYGTYVYQGMVSNNE